jgi:hypothetical protein
MYRAVFSLCCVALACAQNPGPNYGTTLSFSYDLVNVNEDITVHYDASQDGQLGAFVTVVSSPQGNYTQLTRMDQSMGYLYYPYYGGWFCLPFQVTPQALNPFSLAGFTSLPYPASFGGQLSTHYRATLNGYAAGVLVGANGTPTMLTNNENQQQTWVMTKFDNVTRPPASTFAVPSFCSSAAAMDLRGLDLNTSEEGLDVGQWVDDHNRRIAPKAGYRLSVSSGLAAPYHTKHSRVGIAVGGTHDLRSIFLGIQSVSAERLRQSRAAFPLFSSSALPLTSVDNSVYATPVINQGSCGSCWACSSVAAIEVVLNKQAGGLNYSHLSRQFILDCVGPDTQPMGVIQTKGCFGGWQPTAFNYVIKNGIRLESEYPYVAVNGATCPGKGSLMPLSGANSIPPGNTTAIMQAVSQYGGVVAIIEVLMDFVYYVGGVYNNPACDGQLLSHGVTIVGYGNDPISGLDYWLVKNSFGREWGEDGYFRMAKGINMCGIENWATLPIPTPLV